MTMPASLDLLYEEGPCLAVNKPGGLLTQAPPGIDSLEARVREFFRLRDGKPGRVYLGVPHRLDRPVSGVIVLARHSRAARRLCEQFERRMVRKAYWALVAGELAEERGTWTDYLRKVPDEPRGELVDWRHPEARMAISHYVVLGRGAGQSWLEIETETGRMHQIRIQAASRGHPVLGDRLYGSSTAFGPQTEDERARWIALHARRLSFRHPMTGQPVDITAPLPACWPDVARICRTSSGAQQPC
mgnify:CR=1 FL=1